MGFCSRKKTQQGWVEAGKEPQLTEHCPACSLPLRLEPGDEGGRGTALNKGDWCCHQEKAAHTRLSQPVGDTNMNFLQLAPFCVTVIPDTYSPMVGILCS